MLDVTARFQVPRDSSQELITEIRLLAKRLGASEVTTVKTADYVVPERHQPLSSYPDRTGLSSKVANARQREWYEAEGFSANMAGRLRERFHGPADVLTNIHEARPGIADKTGSTVELWRKSRLAFGADVP